MGVCWTRNGPCSPVLQVLCVLGELCPSPAALAAAHPHPTQTRSISADGPGSSSSCSPGRLQRAVCLVQSGGLGSLPDTPRGLQDCREAGGTGPSPQRRALFRCPVASAKVVSAQVPLHCLAPKPCIFKDRVKTITLQKEREGGRSDKREEKGVGRKGRRKIGQRNM